MRLLVAFLAVTSPLIGLDTGALSPASNSGAFGTATNAYSQSDTYATASNGDSHNYTNFSASITAGSTIDGVLIEHDSYKTGSNNNTWIFNLLNVGTCTSKETGVFATSDTDTYDPQGGAADTWSCTDLTQANVTNSAFGVSVLADRAGGPAPPAGSWNLDHLRVTIYYTESSGKKRIMVISQ